MAFSPVEITADNLTERMISRTLLQFRKSPVFIDLLNAMATELQALLQAAIDVIKYRSPADASGEQLDGLGRIVGRLRTLIGFDAIPWFAPDKEETRVDMAPVWVLNAPIAGDYLADDGWFRQLIEAKVSRNFIRYGSVPEIQNYIRQAFGIPISLVRTDVMTVLAIVPDSTPYNVLTTLGSYEEMSAAEHAYFLPLAAGVQLAQVVRMSDYLDSSSS